jgi:repressor LexA
VRADKAGRNAFAVEIDGDSMDLILPEGGWAVIDPDQRSFFDGRVYLVMNGEAEATLKRYRGNPARLEPVSSNDSHGDFVLSGEPITIIGRVVAYGNDEGL